MFSPSAPAFPAGVINIVTGDSVKIGAALTESPSVRKLTFTGSTRVGKLLMAQSPSTVKRVGLELGGNAPFLIFDVADIETAVAGVMASKFRNGGQTCVCANRILVQSGVYDALAERLAQAIATLRVGDGLAEGTTIGPMINSAAIAKIERHVADAKAKGARVAVGGRTLKARFFEPTLLTEATRDMLLASEETFGPVAPLFRFRTEDEAIEIANDTPYGLAAYLYTRDFARCFRVADALEVGMIGINSGAVSYAGAPFGGVEGVRPGTRRVASRHRRIPRNEDAAFRRALNASSSVAGAKSVVVHQRWQGDAVALEYALDDDVAEILGNPDVSFEDRFHQRLVARDAPGDEFQEVVVSSADQMAFLHRVEPADAGFELDEILLAVIAQRHLRKDGDMVDQFGEVEARRVTQNVAGPFEALDAREAGAWRQAHCIGKFDVGETTIVL